MTTPAYLDAAAELLDLRIPAEHRAGVLRYLQLAAEMARMVQAVPLGPADEAGTAFTPISPLSVEGDA